MSRNFHAEVKPLPAWLDWRRLLGPGDWEVTEEDDKLSVTGMLDRSEAADLAARLRKVGIGGQLLELEIVPKPNRKEMRRAQTEEARRLRERSVGFSRKGVRLDAEGKISLTPEALALELGERAGRKRVIDACAGAGGNAIGFARAGCEVVAIELDPERLAMARHNAGIYGVADRIKFLCGDACELLPGLDGDILFVDPPWGGDYNRERVVLEDLPPAAALLEVGMETWLKVPPSFDPESLPGCEVEAVFGVGKGDSRRVKYLLLTTG